MWGVTGQLPSVSPAGCQLPPLREGALEHNQPLVKRSSQQPVCCLNPGGRKTERSQVAPLPPKPGRQENLSTAKLLPALATVADDVKSPALFCGGETDFLPKSGRQAKRSTAKLLPAPATVADDVKSPPFFAAGKRACVAVYSKQGCSQETPLLRGSCPPPQKTGNQGDLTKGSVSRFLPTLF